LAHATGSHSREATRHLLAGGLATVVVADPRTRGRAGQRAVQGIDPVSEHGGRLGQQTHVLGRIAPRERLRRRPAVVLDPSRGSVLRDQARQLRPRDARHLKAG